MQQQYLENMNLNLFSLAGLLLAITSFGLIFIILKYGKAKIHRVWALFNIAVGFWGMSAFFIGKTTEASTALFLWRLSHLGVIFIPIFLFHTVYLLCDLKTRKLLILIYLQGIIFLLLTPTKFFIPAVRFVFSSFYYGSSINIIYHIFFTIWLAIVIYTHLRLFLAYRKSYGFKRNQILYFFLGTIVGFLGGLTNFLPPYKIDIYPFGNFAIPAYCLIVTYAILKYRLMDIRVAFTRAGIFLIVYALILIIPFWIGYYTKSWFITGISMFVLATTGPFIYRAIQKKAEDLILAQQRRYQKILLRAAEGMATEHNLDKLLRLIVYVVKKVVRIRYTAIFSHDRENRTYLLKAARDHKALHPGVAFDEDSPLIAYLKWR
jgi:hypothetical protein